MQGESEKLALEIPESLLRPLLPGAPDPPAKTVKFFCASWRWGFRKEPAEPAGLAAPPYPGKDSAIGVGPEG